MKIKLKIVWYQLIFDPEKNYSSNIPDVLNKSHPPICDSNPCVKPYEHVPTVHSGQTVNVVFQWKASKIILLASGSQNCTFVGKKSAHICCTDHSVRSTTGSTKTIWFFSSEPLSFNQLARIFSLQMGTEKWGQCYMHIQVHR